jgi:pantetheine-phosphate adenylyltransferase
VKVAIYPGSFNPFHRGHVDVVRQALKLFDKVIIAKGCNPDKNEYVLPILTFSDEFVGKELHGIKDFYGKDSMEVDKFTGLFTDYIEEFKDGIKSEELDVQLAVIKGLRNGQDLEYEKNQQYWNEDLGIEIPFFYIISDRKYCHISSSAIRGLEKFKENKDG